MFAEVFTTQAHAKCILAGEHAVLRGYPALVWPIKQKALALTFTENYQPLTIAVAPGTSPQVAEFLLRTLECGRRQATAAAIPAGLTGAFYVHNAIDVGGGLGFSAALCVAVARWMAWRGWIKTTDIFGVARCLEDDYHGRSSGLDIMGAMSDHPVVFTAARPPRDLVGAWSPKLYVSYSGVVKSSAAAIAQVQALMQRDPPLGRLLDEQMADSVALIQRALAAHSAEGVPLLVTAMRQASDCFHQWGLIPPPLQQHIDWLQQAGALAVKPTGAGKGGYVVSLWETTPAVAGLPLVALDL